LFPSKHTQWFHANHLEKAVTYALKQAHQCDVYVGVGLRGTRVPKGRGEAHDVIALPGLYADIDLKHAVHKAGNLPESINDARDILDAISLPPSLLIHSGHGLQAWWLFRELWTFETADERQHAAQLNQRLQATLRAAAERHGWHLDGTADLARVLRIPGTFNRKVAHEVMPVTILEADLDRRYNPSDFDAHLIEITATTQPLTTADVSGDMTPIELHTLKIPTWLKTLIKFAEDVNAKKPYTSRSEALFDAVQGLIKAGCDDRTITSVMLDARYAVSEKAREKGRTWLASELARAHAKLNGHRTRQDRTIETEASEPAEEGYHSSEVNDIGPSTTPDEKPPIHLTDRGNALRLIKAHGRDLQGLRRFW
jgi:hypothetical protein